MNSNQPFASDDEILGSGGLVLKISKVEDMWATDIGNDGPNRLYMLGAQVLLEALLQNCETDWALKALCSELISFDAVSLN
jgi:hypothetical protein